MGKENIDYSNGKIYPVNSKIQGEVNNKVEPFIRLRCRQLIKRIKYTFEVEYYPEMLDEIIKQTDAISIKQGESK